jgi:hypothetical protein
LAHKSGHSAPYRFLTLGSVKGCQPRVSLVGFLGKHGPLFVLTRQRARLQAYDALDFFLPLFAVRYSQLTAYSFTALGTLATLPGLLGSLLGRRDALRA